MISNRRPPRLAILGALVIALALALPAGAVAATKLVSYRGWHARVPASWPVYRLAAHPHTCLRFDRHAVYLGTPSTSQRCPAGLIGRTASILVSPRATPGSAGANALRPGSASGAAVPSSGAAAQIARPSEHVTVTATWSRRSLVVRRALGVRSLTAAAHAWQHRAAARTRATASTVSAARLSHSLRTGALADATKAAIPATAGEVYTGLGFDACSAPSTSALAAWAASPFRAVGVYIGGENMACSQTNLTAAWATAAADAGWHLIPIYVGLQAPNNGCGCAGVSPASAAAEGTSDAEHAIENAQALGLGTGNPIYFDMENYTRTTTASQAVLAFLGAWTAHLHAAGYLSGVYSSELSGIKDLVAEQGTGYVEPDEVWIANWNGTESTSDADVPATEWADHQRMHQYRGGHTDDYGGTSINIDSDYVDAATASPGTGSTVTTTVAATPTVGAAPQANGTTILSPSWSGESGVTRWRILAGSEPTSLSAMLTVPASHHTVVTHNGYGYFQVQALGAGGTTLGTSGVIAPRPHVAIFGQRAFVPSRGPGGLPVECFGITGCRASTTIREGKRLLVHTGYQRIAAGGGIAHFPLTARAHRLVAAAHTKGLPVTVTVRTRNGRSAKRTVKLVPFTVSGRGPARVAGASSALRLLGETDFVSRGWTGGILVACVQSAPCVATPGVTIGGATLATAHATKIGAESVGYLPFRMTSSGHRRLMSAKGNQLGATVTVRTAGAGLVAPTTATAAVSLDAF